MARYEQLSVTELLVEGIKNESTGEVLTASISEINAQADISSLTQALAAAGAIELGAKFVGISKLTGDSYAVTLAAPTAAQVGLVKVIQMVERDNNAVTLALTNVIGGTAVATATFDAANETLVLVGGVGKWIVLAEVGVTLS